jgi:hypothetical protein
VVLTVDFEPDETIPPAAWAQAQLAITTALALHGFRAKIHANRDTELAAYQRFWEWNAAERAKRDG